MSDFDLPREAVEAAIRAHHNFVLGEDVPLTKRDIGIVFQAWHAALTAALPYIATLPTVKPTLEQVVDVLAAQPPGRGEWTSSRIMQTARAVLALLPGRTESEVKAEALREVAETFRAEDKGGDWWYADWLEQRAARIEKEADRG